MASGATEAEQYLAEKQFSLAAVVSVESVEHRVWVLEDGDHMPVMVVRVKCEELLSGASDSVTTGDSITTGASVDILQFDHSSMMMKQISPPAQRVGRYLLVATDTKSRGETPKWFPSWIAVGDGFNRIRGEERNAFVWAPNGEKFQRIPVADLRAAIAKPSLSLRMIDDLNRRIETAQWRMKLLPPTEIPEAIAALEEAAQCAQEKFEPKAAAKDREANETRQRVNGQGRKEAGGRRGAVWSHVLFEASPARGVGCCGSERHHRPADHGAVGPDAKESGKPDH